MEDTKMEAAIIFDSHVPNALRRALEYAGDDGFVASMPQLLRARANAPYDNIIWNTWFTVNGGAKLVHPGGAKLVHLTLCGTRCWGVVPVVHESDPISLDTELA